TSVPPGTTCRASAAGTSPRRCGAWTPRCSVPPAPEGGRAMTAALSLPTSAAPPAGDWAECRFLTCSVLPVRAACNLRCPFCFSRSSVSALRHEPAGWDRLDVEDYYRFARDRGATRLVVTGGGEPLLRPDDVVRLVALGRRHFGEVACFTNGTNLTP